MVSASINDICLAQVKPPAEALFVCKLNPVTTDEDLELIFSRFGKIKECAIIRDFKTGDSLNYAFIEFETEDAVLEAYEKMNNVLIDDRRIKVGRHPKSTLMLHIFCLLLICNVMWCGI
jgi:peptidyl-prolyl cis-trans isomerase-like 4